MSRATLIDLIGAPDHSSEGDTITYTLSGFGSWCGNAYSHLEIKFHDDRVNAWRSNRGGREPETWFERNMVCDADDKSGFSPKPGH